MKDKELHIAFDAKRAFFNRSGLGNYSRDLIKLLACYAPENKYYLYKDKNREGVFFSLCDNTTVVLPQGFWSKKIAGLWRQKLIVNDIDAEKVDIFHGLSQELPVGIDKIDVKTVVTIHDCIFMRYPELFDISYRVIFKRKYEHACKVAHRIIAISEQTKQDVISFLGVDENRIDVVYQGCNSSFYHTVDSATKQTVHAKYKLPTNYILYVGSIEERKNLMSVFKAMVVGSIQYPVVAVGKHTDYCDKVKAYVKEHHLDVTFIHDGDFVDFPAIYQMAKLFVYPSLFEGFGIPILEALNSRVPVITTQGGVFPEVGGNAAWYVEYGNEDQMLNAIQTLLTNQALCESMCEKGYEQALKFREDRIVDGLLRVYNKVL